MSMAGEMLTQRHHQRLLHQVGKPYVAAADAPAVGGRNVLQGDFML